jgi:hypothetical protein
MRIAFAAPALLLFLAPAGCGGGSDTHETSTSGTTGSGGGGGTSGTTTTTTACTTDCCDPAQKPDPASCGLNGRGTQDPLCQGTTWGLTTCTDPDECKDGTQDVIGSCGPNDSGKLTNHCVSGSWKAQCEGADACTNGDTRPGTGTCGFAGHLQQQCQGGQWVDTLTCAETSPDDTQLLADEAAQTLSFQCFKTALTPDEMIAHFPDGSPRWTPDSQTRASMGVTTIVQYTRTCNQLTGCGQWTYLVGSGDRFHLGYVLDTSGGLWLWQGRSQPPGYDELVLPVTGGMTLATLSTDEIGFGSPQRFLVKVTDTCFSLSTLVTKTAPDASGKWTEIVYGALEQWTWTADPHPTPAPVPALDATQCPKVTTTTQELAAAWFKSGQSTKYLGSGFWDLSKTRNCTPYTSCDAWVDDSSYSDPVLKVVGTSLELTLDGRTFPLNADGTFGDATMYGHLTPTCAHFWHHETTPNAGGLAGGTEVAQEWVIP